MPATIHVDITALHRLARQLLAVSAALGRTGADAFADRLDPYVGSALRGVQHDWSHARSDVRRFLDGAGQAASAAAQAYTAVDGSLVER